jgi:AcrR family transcriptional regulator
MDDLETRPLRARRLPADEVRERMLAAARGVIAVNGLTVGFAHLPMEEYIRLAEVPRSSVYRIWSTREEFVADLIGEVFVHDRYAGGDDPEAQELMHQVYERHTDRLATSIGRRAVAWEMIRIGANANMANLRRSVDWSSYNALLACTFSMEEGPAREAVRATAKRIETMLTHRMQAFYQDMLDVFRGSLRPGFTTLQLAHLTAIVIDGLAHRSRLIDEELDAVITAPGLTGEPVPWNLAAWTIRSIVEGMLEPPAED